MCKVVLAIDSFKSCLSSERLSQAASEGIERVLPKAQIRSVSISDGGEGFLQAYLHHCNAKTISCVVSDPLMRKITASYITIDNDDTAVIEMAQSSGLPLLHQSEYNPMLTTTYGVGQLIAHAIRRGIRHFVIGLGGSATNDAGVGMLQALGYRFYDSEHRLLGQGGCVLPQICFIDTSGILDELSSCHFDIASDVTNPLFGPNGAAYTFAPQKGADQEMVLTLDRGLRHFSDIVYSTKGIDISMSKGAGAAGGLGAAFIAFLNSQVHPGIELLLNTIHFDSILNGADYVITGEGKVDRQTLMGKVPYGILLHAQAMHIPVFVIAGVVEDKELLLNAGFSRVQCINPQDVSTAQALQPDYAYQRVCITVASLCREWLLNK